MPAEKPCAIVKQELSEQIASQSELVYVKREAPGKHTEETNNAVVTAKKRGRKKKSEVSSLETSVNPESSNIITTRANRAKKVDYFALVNDRDYDGDSAPKRRKRRNNKVSVDEQLVQKNQNSNNSNSASNNSAQNGTPATELPISPKRR